MSLRIFSHSDRANAPTEFIPCMIVVQARLGSTRLPGKVFKKILGKTLLGYQLERLKWVKNVAGIVVATTTNPKDQPIVDWCNHEGYHCIQGSEEDVLSRYVAAAEAFGLEAVVRVTSDCPLIDPELVERGVELFLANYKELDYLSICHPRSYPLGMDFEVVRTLALEKAYFSAQSLSDKEHVTPYIWKHPEKFRLANLQQQESYSSYRLTVDTQEDFTLIEHIIKTLYPDKPEFRLADILQLLNTHPDWLKINAHIEQKRVK